MRPHFFLLVLLLLLSPRVEAAEPEFLLTADSQLQPGIPKGEIIKETFTSTGGIFPGTQREYQIYIPQGLDRTKPSAFMVFQDGVIYQAPVVFDNLIAKKDIPPLIGIFIKPGVVPASNENALPRFNRSYEYDSITDNYSRFLIEEFLPALEAKHHLKLSADPNDAAISGNSSGGIAAFMVAWHRPDRFRRVFTGVGTYVGIHGGDRLPVLVRKLEPKPIRIFLQSGTGDNNLYCGDWWMANQMMERSFTWSGYEVNHAWGEGGHNGKHATQIFPDVLRWLWKDWQTNKEIKANAKEESKWKGYEVCEAEKGWEAFQKAEAKFLDVTAEGVVSIAKNQNQRSFNQKGRKFDQEPATRSHTTLSPDQTLVYRSMLALNGLLSQQVDADGNLTNTQEFYQLESSMSGDGWAHIGGMCVDTEGRLYVATSLGIQVCDQAGRVNFIIPTPSVPHDVCFGGKDLSELFIACGTTVYKRATKVHGIVSGQMPPIKPAAPKL
jgi:enterochelin esterase-like enzyme